MDDMQSAILLCNYVGLFPRHDVVLYLDECTCRRTFLSSERVIILVFYSPTPLQHYKVTFSAGALNTRGKEVCATFDRNCCLSRKRYDTNADARSVCDC